MNNQQNLRPLVHKVDNKAAKHFEERMYLVCLNIQKTDEQEWTILHGRTAAYEYLKERADEIDYETSFILVESLPLEQRISIYAFLKKVSDYFEDNFDPDDYIKGDWDEDYFINSTNVSSQLRIPNEDRLSMEDMLNGNVTIEQLD